MVEPYRFSVTESAERIRDGRLTPTELVESLLSRITELEPRLDAWVTVDTEGALKSAKTLTREAAARNLRGPLHGIPVGIKDIFNTKGLRTTMGSPLFSNYVPESDARIVERLREAGAIILGKTETTEFAYLDPAPTKNPWNIEYTPGGSSSGSAAAVASRMCPLAFGTQTGGSITRPASFCGVPAIKPTHGLLSNEGVYPQSWTLDHIGFMARSVGDLSTTLQALTGMESMEPMRKPRIGLPATYFNEVGAADVIRNYSETAEKLRRNGANVVELELPESFRVVHPSHRIIMFAEAAAVHESKFRESPSSYQPNIQGEVYSGLIIPSSTYLRAQRIRGIFRREMLSAMYGIDALLTPATITPPLKGLTSTGDAAFNVPWSFTGLPTVNIPSGLNEEGLPLGVQLIGRPYGEASLLGVASWCEKVLHFTVEPPLD
jgi:Asp-tRNA(Asn)/Glu-tRNA(Gln) amidotransferase A subunit family amidase